MPELDRRHFLKLAAALGAALAWGCTPTRPSSSRWRERRDLYPQGIASGDPDENTAFLESSLGEARYNVQRPQALAG